MASKRVSCPFRVGDVIKYEGSPAHVVGVETWKTTYSISYRRFTAAIEDEQTLRRCLFGLHYCIRNAEKVKIEKSDILGHTSITSLFEGVRQHPVTGSLVVYGDKMYSVSHVSVYARIYADAYYVEGTARIDGGYNHFISNLTLVGDDLEE